MGEHIHDVIVIGAGISGLSSAKVLTDNGADTLVLEAMDRVGGRTWTVQNDQVGWVDLGGAYVGRTQNHLLRMIKDLNLSMYPVNEQQKIVFTNGFSGKRTLYNYWEKPGLDFLTLLDINHILRLMDKMGEEISADSPWLCPHAEEWDKITFKEFIESNITNKTAIEFMRIFIATCVTNEPFSSSALWFLWYVKQCGGSSRIFSTTNGGQEFKVHGGTNQITQRLANLIGNDRVLLNSPVVQVKQTEDLVTVRTLEGREHKSRYLIMATPPAVQQKIHFSPPLNAMRNQLIQRTPMGSVFKCIVYYEKAFWKDKNMCGSLQFIGEDTEFPVTYTLDDSKPDGRKPAIIGFIVAEKAHKITELSRKQRIEKIVKAYAKGFGTDEALNYVDYIENNWSESQYTGGCYTATYGPGCLTRFGPYLRKPIGRMFFAGTECAVEWSGYINGGIQAGEKTARQVLVQLGKLSEKQIDQVEPVSLEFPPLPFNATLFERYAPSARGFIRGLTFTVIAVAATTTAVYFKCPLATNALNKLLKA